MSATRLMAQRPAATVATSEAAWDLARPTMSEWRGRRGSIARLFPVSGTAPAC